MAAIWNARLQDAGIGAKSGSGSDVLARLKARQNLARASKRKSRGKTRERFALFAV